MIDLPQVPSAYEQVVTQKLLQCGLRSGGFGRHAGLHCWPHSGVHHSRRGHLRINGGGLLWSRPRPRRRALYRVGRGRKHLLLRRL